MYIGLLVKYALSLSYFNQTKFLNKFPKNILISNFKKIRPKGAELFHECSQMDGPTDGRTDRQTNRKFEANSRVWQFREHI